MADAYKTLYKGVITDSQTLLFTVGGSASWIVKHWVARNVVNSAVVLRLWRNGTGNDSLQDVLTVPVSGCAEFDGTMAFGSNDTLYAQASVASALTFIVDGDEVT